METALPKDHKDNTPSFDMVFPQRADDQICGSQSSCFNLPLRVRSISSVGESQPSLCHRPSSRNSQRFLWVLECRDRFHECSIHQCSVHQLIQWPTAETFWEPSLFPADPLVACSSSMSREKTPENANFADQALFVSELKVATSLFQGRNGPER